MPRFKMREITAGELGKERAEMLGALVENLQQNGIKEGLIEKIAVQVAGAASSNSDGCFGMENPAELLGNPVIRK